MNDHNLPATSGERAEIVEAKPGAMEPQTFSELIDFSERMARTSSVPKAYHGKPDEIVATAMMGRELGLPFFTALKWIANINGTPAVWGDAPLAIVMRSGMMESIDEELSFDGIKDDWSAVVTVKRRGKDFVTRTFSMADAKMAGLAGKAGPWQQYPKRMLQMRARGFALRDAFPDVLSGIAIWEEEIDNPMRDVTPPDDEATTKGTGKLKGAMKTRQGAKPEEAEDSVGTGADPADEIVAALEKAKNLTALDKATEGADGLSDERKQVVRKAYAEARNRICSWIVEKVNDRLEATGNAAETREHFKDDIADLEKHAPKAHIELMKALKGAETEGAGK